jgi:hypothetical protein
MAQVMIITGRQHINSGCCSGEARWSGVRVVFITSDVEIK